MLIILIITGIILIPEQILLSQTQTKFAVIGDYGNGSQAEADVSDMIDTWNVDFIITNGDNNYDAGAAETIDQHIGRDYNQWIYPYIGSYLPGGSPDNINRFFPSLGNHDWGTGLTTPYLNYFELPGNGFLNTSGNERYYDFVWDNIHFFAIDSDTNEPDGIAETSTQAQWLQAQLSNCVQNHSHWRIVYFHHPPYSSGYHQSTTYMRWNFKDWGAHAVLSGHEHSYERLIVDGLPYFVNGSGGNDLRAFGSIYEGSQVRYLDDYGAQVVTATETKMTLEFWSIGTAYNYVPQLIDSYEIIDQLPVELTFFTVTLDGSKVQLRWQTETEVNNYGFDILRSSFQSTPYQAEDGEGKSGWENIGFVEGFGNSNSPKEYEFIDYPAEYSETYYYKLKQIDNDGTFEYSEEISVSLNAPNTYSLSHNFPNPFNPDTRIEFTIPVQQFVSLKIYNMIGELISVIVNEVKEAGRYSMTFNTANLPSGNYIYQIITPDFTAHRKMTLVK